KFLRHGTDSSYHQPWMQWQSKPRLSWKAGQVIGAPQGKYRFIPGTIMPDSACEAERFRRAVRQARRASGATRAIPSRALGVDPTPVHVHIYLPVNFADGRRAREPGDELGRQVAHGDLRGAREVIQEVARILVAHRNADGAQGYAGVLERLLLEFRMTGERGAEHHGI